MQIGRGLAALLVVAAHAAAGVDQSSILGRVFAVGWSGVDFFFVLSGFIIFYTHGPEIGDRTRFKSFAVKRFRRVLPIYWTYTAIFLAAFVALWTLTHSTRGSWFATDLGSLIGSFVLWPVVQGEAPIIPPAWTLSYEALFYVLFGLAIAFGRRFAIFTAGIWLAILLAAIAGAFGEFGERERFVLLATNPRNLAFLLGCGAGWLVRLKLVRDLAMPILFVGLIVLGAAWTWALGVPRAWEQPGVVSFGLAYFLIVTGLAARDLRGPLPCGGVKSPFLFLGDASYSVYLLHYITLVFIGPPLGRVGLAGASGAIAGFMIAAAVGCVGYWFIERPLLSRMRQGSPMRGGVAWIVSGVAVVGAVAIGLAAQFGHDAPLSRRDRVLNDARQLASGGTVVFGDSLTERSPVEKACGPNTLNAGVGGAKVAETLALAPAVLRLSHPTNVVIAIGVNDARRDNRASLSNFRSSYEMLATLAGSRLKALVAISPIEAGKTYSAEYDPRRVAAQNQIISELAHERHVLLVPPAAPAIGRTIDGVHQTPEATRSWIERLARACAPQHRPTALPAK